MPILAYDATEAVGQVQSVDTASVVVAVDSEDMLRGIQVNRLVALQSSRPGQHLIGLVQRITRSAIGKMPAQDEDNPEDEDELDDIGASVPAVNTVRISLIGTLIDRLGTRDNVFRRTLESVPEIDANCFLIEKNRLTSFMQAIASENADEQSRLSIGHYTLDDEATAYLDGNKFFQRHAMVVGSTGSGKSWTVAHLLEQVAHLPHGNAILFDVHGEYRSLDDDGIVHLRIAGPGDIGTGRGLAEGVLYLPVWLLGYEEMISTLIDRSDANAPNQAMVLARSVTAAKRSTLEAEGKGDVLANFTIDSPVHYSIDDVMNELDYLNTEMVQGTRGPRQGDFHGRLSRLIARIENKRTDRRLGFMFQASPEVSEYTWLERLGHTLVGRVQRRDGRWGGVKILDVSEVPSDVLPVVLGTVARIVFSIQQWTPTETRHPIALLCEEAHLYISEQGQGDTVPDAAVRVFERVAKEGRKHGVGLVVISQRPSEVSRTVLSQCNNVVAMRLTNAEDQNAVKRLLPDSLGGFGEVLPILDVGEALIVGDASMLPTRVRVDEPVSKPTSGTVPFWTQWSLAEVDQPIERAVNAWRLQSMS